MSPAALRPPAPGICAARSPLAPAAEVPLLLRNRLDARDKETRARPPALAYLQACLLPARRAHSSPGRCAPAPERTCSSSGRPAMEAGLRHSPPSADRAVRPDKNGAATPKHNTVARGIGVSSISPLRTTQWANEG